MADNYVTNPGTGGDTFAADDVGGIKTPRVKLQWGPDGTVNDADVATGKPIPVQLRGSDGTDRSNLMPMNMTQINGVAITTGNGTATNAQRVVIALDNTAFSVNAAQSGSWSLAANQSVNNAQIAGVATATGNGNVSTGVQRVAIATDNTPFSVNATPKVGTTGGATPYMYLAAASTNQDSQSVKGSAGHLYGYDVFNTNAALRYVKIYDKATAPTSSDTPKLVILVPGNTAGAGAVKDFANGVVFTLGIGIRITTGQANSDATAVTAGDVVVNLQYA